VNEVAERRKRDAPMPPWLVRALRDAAFWMAFVIALMLLLALASYSPRDAGFSSTGATGLTDNWIGRIGAWVADLFLLVFGRPAYLFPLMIGLGGWFVFRSTKLPEARRRATFAWQLVGFVVTVAASCGLAALHWSGAGYPSGAGGVLGGLIGENLATNLSFLGATLLLLGLWMAGTSLFIGVSWLNVMDSVGRFGLRSWQFLRMRIAAARTKAEGRERREERAEHMREEQRKSATRSPPRIEPVVSPPEKSERVEKEKQVPLFEAPPATELPALSLLDDPPPHEPSYSTEALEAMSRLVELKLRDFGVDVEVVAVHPGPVVTRFELRPAPGVKVSQISNLAKDLARALSAISVRVVEVIPGKSVVGLEIPNEKRELVTLGEIIKSKAYDDIATPLALALGKDIGGYPVVADLTRMPHLLIAGTTGSGKSVAINAMVLSLLYKSTAEHVRLVMIDPKMLELSVYEGIPHLLAPVVTDMKQAANALRWAVAEMDRRFQLMAAVGVRNLGGLNRKLKEAIDAGQPLKDPVVAAEVAKEAGSTVDDVPDLMPLPHIVVVIDELADLMLIVGKKVEELITRLAQKARASGIHLILATQRPSVDVITGLIKANIPSRIAFQVSAKVDSRTILDQSGAEALLSHGDMLYLAAGTSVPTRIHGAFVSDQEVHRVVNSLRVGPPPIYIDAILEGPSGSGAELDGEEGGESPVESDAEQDPLYDEAVRIVTESRKASISGVQRRLKIGYNRAARLVEAMEAVGLVGPLQTNGSREVLAPPPPES